MSSYTIKFVGRNPVPNVDAQALYLWVECNGGYFQHVAIAVSGPDLHERWGTTPDHPRFWPAVATLGLRAIRVAVEHGRLPTDAPERPWTRYVNRSDIDRIIHSDAELPVLVDQEMIARFDLA